MKSEMPTAPQSATGITAFFSNLKLDIRYTYTRFIAQPGTSLVIILTLALSIGATTAIFSVVNGLMFQATPFKDSEQLMIIHQQDKNSGQTYGFSASELVDYQQQASTVETIAEYHSMTFTMLGRAEPVRVRAGIISSNFFDMLDVKPILGRTFTASEDDIGAEPLLLLTYEFWLREFNGDPDVVNQSVEFNNRSHKIIGVLAHFPQFPDVNDIYMAIPSCPWRSGETALSNRNMRMMSSIAKRANHATLAAVNAEISTIANRLQKTYPEAYGASAEFSATAGSVHEALVSDTRPYLYTLLGTTLLLFLIAIANVTNLTLSQQTKRKREFAVRASLGASKARIAQQLLTESVLFSLAGGLLGLLLAFLGLDLLKTFAASFSSLASEITIDSNVMIFVLVISLFAGVVAGLAPSLQNANLVTSLKEGGKASYSTEQGLFRNGLLMGQFALSLTLLIAAGLTIKSLTNLQNIDRGFKPAAVSIAQLDLNWTTYASSQQVAQFAEQILQQVRNLPQVDSAALATTYPSDTFAINSGLVREALYLDDRDVQFDDVLQNTFVRSVSDGYFNTIGASMLHGRPFDHNDDGGALAVAIINNSLATHLWPNESAIDHRISTDAGQNWYTVVGVVADILENGADQPAGFRIYRPFAQAPTNHVAILMASHSEHKDAMPAFDCQAAVKTIVHNLDSRQPFSAFETLTAAVDNAMSLQRFLAQLLTAFAVFALVITISGVSGVMSYTVNIRTREIGIRMAIGAGKASVTMMILSYALKLTISGLLLGTVVAYFVGTALSQQLFAIAAFEWAIYASALSTLLVIAIGASIVPAWQASSIAPMQALKSS